MLWTDALDRWTQAPPGSWGSRLALQAGQAHRTAGSWGRPGGQRPRPWTCPRARPRPGSRGVYVVYWFTGYIFDTFNELIQMFYTRKAVPVLLLLRFPPAYPAGSRAAVGQRSRRPQDRGARATRSRAPPPPSTFLGRTNLTRPLWLPPAHGGGPLSFTHVVLIKANYTRVTELSSVLGWPPGGWAV